MSIITMMICVFFRDEDKTFTRFIVFFIADMMLIARQLQVEAMPVAKEPWACRRHEAAPRHAPPIFAY